MDVEGPQTGRAGAVEAASVSGGDPMRSILVIDESASIRETLRIVLGNEHALFVAPSWEAAAPPQSPALVILGLGARRRDLAAAAAALERIAPGAPLLVLHAPTELGLRVFSATGRRVDFLPKPFDAYTLRARVETLLAAGAPSGPAATDAGDRRFLAFPFLPAATAHIARQAADSDLPVLLSGERGTGALDVGRALHAASGRRGSFAVFACGELDRDAFARYLQGRPAGPDDDTILLSDVDAASAQSQHEILALVRGHGVSGTRSCRIVASTTSDLEARVARGDFLAELAYALGTITIALPPLRERRNDIPALVDRLTSALAARLRLGAVTYTEQALARLTRLPLVRQRRRARGRARSHAGGPPPSPRRRATPALLSDGRGNERRNVRRNDSRARRRAPATRRARSCRSSARHVDDDTQPRGSPR